MGARERRKGAEGEREATNLLKRHGFKAKRRGAIQAGRGKDEEADLPDVVVEGSPFWIEVKRGKLPSIRAAFRQAEAEAPVGDIPLVMWRDDGGKWMMAAGAEDILELCSEVLERVEMMAPGTPQPAVPTPDATVPACLACAAGGDDHHPELCEADLTEVLGGMGRALGLPKPTPPAPPEEPEDSQLPIIRNYVRGCSACGGDHQSLISRELLVPLSEGHTHAGICPATGEVVFSRILDGSQVGGG